MLGLHTPQRELETLMYMVYNDIALQATIESRSSSSYTIPAEIAPRSTGRDSVTGYVDGLILDRVLSQSIYQN